MNLSHILKLAVQQKASDIHLTVNSTPAFRINGQLLSVGQINPAYNAKLTFADTMALMKKFVSEKNQKKLMEEGEVDFSFALTDLSRFRANVFMQQGQIAMVIRVIPNKIYTAEELNFKPVIRELSRKQKGLVLVTGPTGSGKSTTLAAIIDLINTEQPKHIITLEDPIEFIHQHKKSIINQREINKDSKTFAKALRAAMRQDPDVILVGEMRDLETISTAITAAETGHLVLGTLHTNSAITTVDRIIDVFPASQQQQIRVQLAATIEGIIAQQLIPRLDKQGLVAAMEIMVATPAIRNLIREGNTHQLTSVIQTSGKYGMQCFDDNLKYLVGQEIISLEEAKQRYHDKKMFEDIYIE